MPRDAECSTLLVTPSRFLPDVLCGCQPGWHGRSTDCRRCGKDHYNAAFNQSECQKCPSGSSTQRFEGLGLLAKLPV